MIKEAWNKNIGDWDLFLKRPLNDREANTWMNIKSTLQILNPNKGEDILVW